MHVVLVDDSIEHLELLADFIEELRPGCRLSLVEDGLLLPDVLASAPADLIMMDLLMPTVDGFELVARLRQDPRWYRTPVIAVSGLGNRDEEDQLRAAGFDAKLPKPFDLSDVNALLDHFLPA